MHSSCIVIASRASTPSMHATSELLCAEPLIMDNGKDLIDMVITNFETPDDEISEDNSGHDYSALAVVTQLHWQTAC